MIQNEACKFVFSASVAVTHYVRLRVTCFIYLRYAPFCTSSRILTATTTSYISFSLPLRSPLSPSLSLSCSPSRDIIIILRPSARLNAAGSITWKLRNVLAHSEVFQCEKRRKREREERVREGEREIEDERGRKRGEEKWERERKLCSREITKSVLKYVL